jgi:hypothetical protein
MQFSPYMMGMADPQDKSRKALPAAAQRALAEATERRKAAQAPDLPREVDGRQGPEPTRYGDWEVKGIASDF